MMTWNVYMGNFNSGRIETYNIFRNAAFREDCQKIVKKYRKTFKADGTFDRKTFAEEIRRELMYYFWSKYEWEVIIDHWPHSDQRHAEKVDVYDQVMLNWDIFLDYIWTNREELIKCRK